MADRLDKWAPNHPSIRADCNNSAIESPPTHRMWKFAHACSAACRHACQNAAPRHRRFPGIERFRLERFHACRARQPRRHHAPAAHAGPARIRSPAHAPDAARLLHQHLRPLRVAVRDAGRRRGLVRAADHAAPSADLLLRPYRHVLRQQAAADADDRGTHRSAPGIRVRGGRGRDGLGRPGRHALRLARHRRGAGVSRQGARPGAAPDRRGAAGAADRLGSPVVGHRDGHRARAHPPGNLLRADPPAQAGLREAAPRVAPLHAGRRGAGKHAGEGAGGRGRAGSRHLQRDLRLGQRIRPPRG